MWCGITPDVGRGMFLGMCVLVVGQHGRSAVLLYVRTSMDDDADTTRIRTYNEFATYSSSHCHCIYYIYYTNEVQSAWLYSFEDPPANMTP